MKSATFFFLFLFWIPSLTANPTVISAGFVTEIKDGWFFQSEFSPEKKAVSVGKALASQGYPPPMKGSYTYEFNYKRSNKPLGIYLDRVQEVDVFLVNGHPVANTGALSDTGNYKPNWYYKRLYYIPDSLLFEDKINTIELKIEYRNQTFQGGLFRSIPKIGNLNSLEKILIFEDGRDFCFIMLFFGIGAYQIFSIVLKRQAKTNFYLLLSTVLFVLWRLPLLNISYTFTDISFDTWLRVFFVSQTLLPVSLFLFNYSLFRTILGFNEKFILAILVFFAIVQMFSITMYTRILFLRFWEVSLPIVLFFVLRSVYRAAKQKKTEAYFLAFGFFALSLGATIDIFIDITTGKNIYLSQYGFLSLMILSGVAISYKNAKNEKELSILTKDLEGRVIERTLELQKRNEDLELDLYFAAQLQSYLLPKEAPKIADVKISATYLPMKQVGGDLYDWIEIDEKRVLILISDVAGHGVPAAFVSSMVKVQFRESGKLFKQPKDILFHMNCALTSLVSKYFITASCALIDTETNTITISSAGHPNPIHIHKNKIDIEFIKLRGPILGWKESFVFTDWEYKFESGDRFFFYTDGVTEARGEGKMFGESRLLKILKKSSKMSIYELSQEIMVEISKYSLEEIKDDISFLIIEIV
ncbi:SpoIIE family protein phosphatase [Leptospira sp. 96542]|nr:SpoIIE family protein phosphatase [Leptospira sp. 96542]